LPDELARSTKSRIIAYSQKESRFPIDGETLAFDTKRRRPGLGINQDGDKEIKSYGTHFVSLFKQFYSILGGQKGENC